jgi:hypothetical protein
MQKRPITTAHHRLSNLFFLVLDGIFNFRRYLLLPRFFHPIIPYRTPPST